MTLKGRQEGTAMRAGAPRDAVLAPRRVLPLRPFVLPRGLNCPESAAFSLFFGSVFRELRLRVSGDIYSFLKTPYLFFFSPSLSAGRPLLRGLPAVRLTHTLGPAKPRVKS